MVRCLLLAIVLLGGASLTLAQQDNFSSVSGRIEQGTDAGNALPVTLPIELQVINSQRQVVQVLTVLTAPDGSFTFEGVPLSDSYVYVLQAEYAGVRQRTPVLTASQLDFVTFLLYDVTTNLDDIEIVGGRVQIDDVTISPDLGTTLVMILELQLKNWGDHIVFVSDNEPPYSLQVELPVGAYGIAEITSANSSGAEHLYIDTETDSFIPVVYDTVPLIPHWYQPNRIHLTYLISFGAEIIVDQPFPVPASNLEVWIPDDLESVQSDDITLMEEARLIGSQHYDIYQARPFDAGDSLIFSVIGQSPSSTPTTVPEESGSKQMTPDDESDTGILYLACIGGLGSLLAVGGWIWYRRRIALEELLAYDRDQETR